MTEAEIRNAAPWTLVWQDDRKDGGLHAEWQSDRYPRLSKRVQRPGGRTLPSVTTWMVDGVRCDDIAEAVRLINGPVIPADAFGTASS